MELSRIMPMPVVQPDLFGEVTLTEYKMRYTLGVKAFTRPELAAK